MVRTSVRTITLKIFNCKAAMLESYSEEREDEGSLCRAPLLRLLCGARLLAQRYVDSHRQPCGLPHLGVSIYHATDYSPRKIDLMMGATEDSNEILFYIQDVFSAGDENINRMLRNALLHYAYLPLVVRSLCSMRLRPILTINTCLYVLTQTFRIMQDSEFLGILF